MGGCLLDRGRTFGNLRYMLDVCVCAQQYLNHYEGRAAHIFGALGNYLSR